MRDVQVERDGAVMTVVMARPERRNAVDGPMAAELAQAFRDFEASDAAVAVLCGTGPSFCAGADLKAVNTVRANRMEPEGDAPMGVTRMRLTKPVIAATHGYVVAGGLELALWCDLRVADTATTFGVLCRRWGVPLVDGGTVRLPRLIGQSRAMDMILTGRPVAADEALQFGLANRVVAQGMSRQAAQELAAQLAALPQTCMRNDRISLRDQWGEHEQAALAREFALGMDSLTVDGRSGAGRFTAGAGRHGAGGVGPGVAGS